MKKFVSVEIEIVNFVEEDVIRTSDFYGTESKAGDKVFLWGNNG